jgi:hypothetical protein
MQNRIKTNWFTTLLALILVIIGFIIFWLPLPIGLVFMAFGFALLVSSNTFAARFLLAVRTHSQRINRLFLLIESRSPPFFRKKLEKTNPIPNGNMIVAISPDSVGKNFFSQDSQSL